MLAALTEELDDIIIKILLNSNQITTKDIFEKIQKSDHAVSLQAIHSNVKRLVSLGVLVKKNKYLSVSQEWIYRLKDLLPTTPTLLPSQGEVLRYSFKNLSNHDAYWKHVFFQLLELYPEEPIFIAVPHQIWPYVPERSESEERFYSYFPESARHTYYSIGGNTREDAEMRKSMRNTYIHVELAPLVQHSHEHVVVIGDAVIITRLHKKDDLRISALYKENLPKDIFAQKIEKLLSSITYSMFMIKNDRKEAKRIRHLIARDYHVPQNVVKKFNLW